MGQKSPIYKYCHFAVTAPKAEGRGFESRRGGKKSPETLSFLGFSLFDIIPYATFLPHFVIAIIQPSIKYHSYGKTATRQTGRLDHASVMYH